VIESAEFQKSAATPPKGRVVRLLRSEEPAFLIKVDEQLLGYLHSAGSTRRGPAAHRPPVIRYSGILEQRMSPVRASERQMAASATTDAVHTLDQLGLQPVTVAPGHLEAEIDGHRVSFDVVAVAYATGPRVQALVGTPPGGHVPLLVSDRITSDARRVLEESGWSYLDRRGHLRLRAPRILVDTQVPPASTPTQEPDPREPLAGAAGLAVAYRLLVLPDRPATPTKSGTGFAPSTISVALRRIRDAGLIDSQGRPILPELFWALAERWRPRPRWLAQAPDPSEAGDDPAATGWRLTGTSAAVELGAPVVASGSPLDLYVPGPAALTIALRRHGLAPDPAVAAASIAVPPVSAVTTSPASRRADGWPLAHPVAVALDLAQDRGRGREILQDWNPAERVW
jgi:hypothetical protein